MKRSNKKSHSPPKKLLIILVVLTLAVLAALYLTQWRGTDDLGGATDEPNPYSRRINYDPPTDEEKKAGDQAKDEIAQDEATPNTQTQQTANVVITDAGQYDDAVEVRAFVSNVYEDGVCHFVFALGSQTILKQSTAFKDARDTQCQSLRVARSEFSTSGTWKVTVTYTSKSSSLSGSSSQTLKVK